MPTDEELRERYPHIFAGLSARDLDFFEGSSMAEESRRFKGTPEIEQLPDETKRAAEALAARMDGVTQDGASSEGGTVRSGHYQRAQVREAPGRGGIEGVYAEEARHDPHKPAPRLDIADLKEERQSRTPALSDRDPRVKDAYEQALKGHAEKDGLAREKDRGLDGQQQQEGRDQGRDI